MRHSLEMQSLLVKAPCCLPADMQRPKMGSGDPHSSMERPVPPMGVFPPGECTTAL